MNQQPDKLFREKLKGYQKPAPAPAWEKIAAAQPKKNDNGLWLKIAASLLLLAIATYLLWPKNDTIGTQQNILTETSKEQPGDITVPQHKQDQKALTEVNVQNELIAKLEKPSSKKRTVKRTTLKEEQLPEVTIAQKTNPELAEALPIAEEINKVVPVTESVETAIAEAQFTPAQATENITLVFTANEVNEYLDKKALAQATSDEKKPSTLKKLLKKANDLKNNQDPFGELRQKKNEILALNFKNEKQRGQNK